MREMAPHSWWALNVGGYDVGIPTEGQHYTAVTLPASVPSHEGARGMTDVMASSISTGKLGGNGQQDLLHVDDALHPGTFLLMAFDDK